MPLARRQIVRSCKDRGWTIQPRTLQALVELEHLTDPDDLEVLLDHLDLGGTNVVTEAALWRVLEGTDATATRAANSSRNKKARAGHDDGDDDEPVPTATSNDLAVVNAFETPKLVYEAMRKQFYVEEKRYALFGTADDKTNMFAQRYALIHQRLLRNELFRPQDLTRNSAQHKLTPIESLLGKTQDQTLLLLGMLLQIEEGQWYLEDPTGQVPISFQSALAVDGFFVTEQCVLLVEGYFHDGTFYVLRLGQPLLEDRDVSMAAIRQQVSHPAYAVSPSSSSLSSSVEQAPALVLLSDVHLDQPRVAQQLEGLFATYEPRPHSQLPLFVLMGNFSSSSTANDDPVPLEELGSLIATFDNLSRHAHFVLVPGPDDTPGITLPLPNTLSRTGFGKVAHVHWATNPCRIRQSGWEVVIFRYDLLHLLQRQQLLLPESYQSPDRTTTTTDSSAGTESTPTRRSLQPHCRLIKTILEQGHLCPVAGVPIVWNYDYTLSLYPVPQLLVLGGDGASPGYYERHGGCHVVHPGSMGAHGSYATFGLEGSAPTANGEDLDDNDDEEDDGPRVTIQQLGVNGS